MRQTLKTTKYQLSTLLQKSSGLGLRRLGVTSILPLMLSVAMLATGFIATGFIGTASAQRAGFADSADQSDLIIGADRLSAAFRNAAQTLQPSVVTITSLETRKVRRNVRGNFGPGGLNDLDAFRGMLPDSLLEQLEDAEVYEDDGLEFEESDSKQQTGMGSGVIVSPDGYILTNNHVISRADELQVELTDGRSFEAKVIGADPKSDIAVLKIDANNLQAAKIGDSEKVQVGDWVIAIGSPFGLSQTVTAGIISATNRSTGIIRGGFEDFLQTDAAINPGNSGGPLVNLRGEVIGVNTAINSRTGTNVGVGFAIPSSMAAGIMQDLKSNGRVIRGYIGALLANVAGGNASGYRLPPGVVRGAAVEAVEEGGPADQGSLKVGDVITRVNGKLVKSSNELINAVTRMRPNSELRLEGYRDGQPLALRVVTGERTEESLSRILPSLKIEELAIEVRNLSPRQQRELNAESGVIVWQMSTRGRGAALGLRPGDVIVELNGEVIESVQDLERIETDATSLRMIVQRGSRMMTMESRFR
ncbi:MAG: Do family serine endopeptidase [Pirellulaceae bacterium]